MFQPDVILTDAMMPGMSGRIFWTHYAAPASPCR